ncbi:unnamed protein product [Calypogeia fissa]
MLPSGNRSTDRELLRINEVWIGVGENGRGAWLRRSGDGLRYCGAVTAVTAVGGVRVVGLHYSTVRLWSCDGSGVTPPARCRGLLSKFCYLWKASGSVQILGHAVFDRLGFSRRISESSFPFLLVAGPVLYEWNEL